MLDTFFIETARLFPRDRLHAALGVVLCLALAEIAIRYFYDVHYVYDPEVGYLHAPGVMRNTAEAPPAESTWTVGGLRRKAPPDLARPRVLILGDSFTEAAMIDDGNVFSDRLAMAMPQYQFLNAGRSSMSAADYVAFAAVYQRRFDASWTVIQLRASDLAQDAFQNATVCHYTQSSDGRLILHEVVTPHRGGPIRWLRERSMFTYFMWLRYNEYRSATADERPLFCAPRRAVVPPPRHYPVEQVMDATADAYGRRLTFAFLASYDPDAPVEDTPEERRIWAHCAARGYSCVSTRAGYQRFADEGRAPFGFSTSAFNEGHMNDDGHALLAEVVARELQRLHALL